MKPPHFTGHVEGRRRATRCGDEKDGMVTRLQCGGWDVEVTAYVSAHNGHTYATILLQHYATGEVRHAGAFDLTTGTPLRRTKEVTRKWKP